MSRHNTMVTCIFESALRIHTHRVNDTCVRIRHAARLQCIRLVADQRATHPQYDFAALRRAWFERHHFHPRRNVAATYKGPQQ